MLNQSNNYIPDINPLISNSNSVQKDKDRLLDNIISVYVRTGRNKERDRGPISINRFRAEALNLGDIQSSPANMAETQRRQSQIAYARAITLPNLPVEVVPSLAASIQTGPNLSEINADRYPLRGTLLRFDRPTDPVLEEDWNHME